jgi:elongation factor P
MYDTSDLRKGLKILIDGNPYIVVQADFVKPGKGAAFTRTKMKNLLTGGVIERNIRSGEKIEPADIEENEMTFLYKEGESFVFMNKKSYEQVIVPKETVDETWQWLKDNLDVQVMFYNGRAIGVTAPNFVNLKVTKSDPGVRGDTASGASKPATLETGASINVPLFINQGDVLRIDTRTGEYVERVKE